jgi:hypothetical protein
VAHLWRRVPDRFTHRNEASQNKVAEDEEGLEVERDSALAFMLFPIELVELRMLTSSGCVASEAEPLYGFVSAPVPSKLSNPSLPKPTPNDVELGELFLRLEAT